MARTFVFTLASLSLLCVSVASAEEDASSVSILIQQLSSDDTQERREAAYELADLGPDAKEAVPALIKALADRDTQVWAEATGALARIGPDAAAAVDELMSHLSSRDRQRWYRTAHALGKIGEPALTRLRDSLQSETSHLRAGSATRAWLDGRVGSTRDKRVSRLSGRRRRRNSPAGKRHALEDWDPRSRGTPSGT